MFSIENSTLADCSQRRHSAHYRSLQPYPNPLCPTDDLKIGYKNKREKGIFQRRYWEHTIRNKEELNEQINYIHYNPVKHGYVHSVKDWDFSSFHKFVQLGLYEENWGSLQDIENIKNLDFE